MIQIRAVKDGRVYSCQSSLFDFNGCFKQIVAMNLWEDSNGFSLGYFKEHPSIKLKFDIDDNCEYIAKQTNANNNCALSSHDFEDIIYAEILSDFQKTIVWRNCKRFLDYPRIILQILVNPIEEKALLVLREQKSIAKFAFWLKLLGEKYRSQTVRDFAARTLFESTEFDIKSFVPQLVQALKFEPYLDNELTRKMLQTALKCRFFGNKMFWEMKVEMQNAQHQFRYAAILKVFLLNCGNLLNTFDSQQTFLDKLVALTEQERGKPNYNFCLKSEVKKLLLTHCMPSPLRPGSNFTDFQALTIMDSKKLPMIFQFKEGNVMFKQGDNLRQDCLVLQCFKIMQRIWDADCVLVNLLTYDCIATSTSSGYIEIVPNAETVSKIQIDFGGSVAAFRSQPLAEWLKQKNVEKYGEFDFNSYKAAVEMFVQSCAASCVVTFVLGIGDRHNGNIMLTRDGELFHIDFGHFLGNIKRKLGVKRERTPFVLTPDFLHVMHSILNCDMFSLFEKLAVDAFLSLRKHSDLLQTMLSLMLTAELPELKSDADIAYLREALCLDLSDTDARIFFKGKMDESIRLGWSTQVNWWLHNIAHNKS